MQLKIFLILFCIIAVLFVGFNEGTTTKSTKTKSTTTESTTTKNTTTKRTTTKKATPISKQKIATQTKPMIVGGHTPWDTKIKPKHQKVFADYKKIILKKLQQVHNVSNSFVPKPEKFSTQIVGGINYLYLVKLPINKYAFVSIYDRVWKKDHYGKEENVQVRPKTYELDDKTV